LTGSMKRADVRNMQTAMAANNCVFIWLVTL
jgi:hypothetical protein